MAKQLCALLPFLFATYCNAGLLFINELHYDNSGADKGEFIELAGHAGTNLSDWSLVLYNGNDGSYYDNFHLSGLLTDQSNGFGFTSINTPGLQNGSPDGIALVEHLGAGMDIVRQFISYEGAFMATNGYASGLMSVDIGITEDGTTPTNWSLQLMGSGNKASDFTWHAAAQTQGEINLRQQFMNENTPSATVPEPPSYILLILAFTILVTIARNRSFRLFAD